MSRLLTDVNIGQGNQNANNGPHGTHSIMMTRTSDGTIWVTKPNLAYDQAAYEIESTGWLLLNSVDNYASVRYTSPLASKEKPFIFPDYADPAGHHVYCVWKPAYQFNPAWRPHPEHSWNPMPYVYSSRTNSLIEITDSNWWYLAFLEGGNGDSITAYPYAGAGLLANGDFVWLQTDAPTWPPGTKSLSANFSHDPQHHFQWFTFDHTARTWTGPVSVTATQGRYGYEFLYPYQSGFVMFATIDQYWKDKDAPDNVPEHGPSPFNNQFGFDEIGYFLVPDKAVASYTYVRLEKWHQVLPGASSTPSNTAFEITDVYRDPITGEYDVLAWGGTNDGNYFSYKYHVNVDTGVVSRLDLRALGMDAVINSRLRRICKDSTGRYYYMGILGNTMTILACTDADTNGSQFLAPENIALTQGEDITDRWFRVDSRTGQAERQSTIYTSYPLVNGGAFTGAHANSVSGRFYDYTVQSWQLSPPGGVVLGPTADIPMVAGVGKYGYAAGQSSFPGARTAFWGGNASEPTECYVGTVYNGGVAQVYRYFLAFDLSAIPAGSVITRAYMLGGVPNNMIRDAGDTTFAICKLDWSAYNPLSAGSNLASAYVAAASAVRDVDWFTTARPLRATTPPSPDLDVTYLHAGQIAYYVIEQKEADINLTTPGVGNSYGGIATIANVDWPGNAPILHVEYVAGSAIGYSHSPITNIVSAISVVHTATAARGYSHDVTVQIASAASVVHASGVAGGYAHIVQVNALAQASVVHTSFQYQSTPNQLGAVKTAKTVFTAAPSAPARTTLRPRF